MTIHIKNMVCHRCIMAVQGELEKLHIQIKNIQLGEVTINGELSSEQMSKLSQNLTVLGFEIIDNKRSFLVERIKNIVIVAIHHKDSPLKINFSELISKELNHDYNYLSHLFSEVEGITIEKYVIAQKIEKVKELLVYDELSLSEIAYQMNYSSVAYLSNQFKKVTGLTPSHFKQIKENKRKPLDKV